ncbi:MAG TPA: amidohydrolase/deacetylase family metallohydrolase, partial [Chloroflexota bacterium]|nr:amidohydrolase/deacetylase family metallohydrolase [Chloroflexota bacterium]
MFDLILKGGRVIDPSRGTDLEQDVAITGSRIAGISASVPSDSARQVLDVSGKIVVPGLVDLHTHIYPGVISNGVEVDETCLRRGVTTAVDGGSSGTENFGGFLRWIAGQSKTRVFCFLHLSAIGQAATRRAGELANPAYADPEGAIELIRLHSDVIVGLKLRASRPALGGPSLPMLQAARRVLDATGVPMMIHIGDTVEPLGAILDSLR